MNDVDNLIQILAKFLGPESPMLTAQTRWEELGMDSLASLRFARKVEDALAIQIDLEDLFDCVTVEDLAAQIRSSHSLPPARG